ncbi:MAG: flagellar M-ring protein FliF, partial [Rhodospirillales bacterium]|nr:flagellar M-ring protein FliF [Rhodospirillales bacterium]
EKFDPEGQVVRSTQTLEHSTSAQESEANNAVTVAGTLPDSQVGAGESASNKSADARTEETVNFEISKKVINHVRESGIINRLSVAVLVDGNYKRNQEDEMIYSPRTKEEMEQLAALVRTAVGYNPDRGDSVEVVNLKFAAVEAPPEPPIQLFFGFEKNDMLRIAEILVLSIVAVLVILLVVRPLVTRAFESLPAAASALSESAMLAQQAMSPALTGPERGAPGEENFEDMIDLERIEGRVKASSVKKVGEIVTKHPEEALSIIRNWLYQET